MSSIRGIEKALEVIALDKGLEAQACHLRARFRESNILLTSELCFELAKKHHSTPEEIAHIFSEYDWEPLGVIFQSDGGFLNFKLLDYSSFDWKDYSPCEPSKVVIDLETPITPGEHLRILGCACLQIYLLQRSSQTFCLYHGNNVQEGSEVAVFDLFRTMLMESLNQFERDSEQSSDQFSTTLIWTHPEQLKTHSLRESSSQCPSKLLYPLRRYANRPWLELPNFSSQLDKLVLFDEQRTIDLWVYLSSAVDGADLFPETVEFEESANVMWLLRSTLSRIDRIYKELKVNHGDGLHSNFPSLVEEMIPACGYWLAECAARFGETVSLVDFMMKFLEKTLGFVNHPEFRDRCSQGSVLKAEWEFLEEVRKVLAHFLSLLSWEPR